MINRFFVATLVCATLIFPTSVFAASNTFVYAAWLPYWKKASGTPEMLAHVGQMKELSPFSYEVEPDGTIGDAMRLAREPWVGLFAKMHSTNAKIIPTVSWIDGNAIETTLHATSSRVLHEDDLISMVKRNSFDGLDIDYEGKKSTTRYYFSQFIKELSVKLHKDKKILSCTIEARTPPSSLFWTPKKVEYVNDYVVLNKYCDEVRIMTYDQTTADIRLSQKKGEVALYAPVADNDWVEKVIREAKKTIAPSKIMMGIPTYGYEFIVDRSSATMSFQKMRSINYQKAMLLAASQGITPARNNAGERSFNYEKDGVLHYVSFNDATSITKKIALAKKLKLRGVAIFKVDGEADPTFWAVLK